MTTCGIEGRGREGGESNGGGKVSEVRVAVGRGVSIVLLQER